jgi:hypothetical protein
MANMAKMANMADIYLAHTPKKLCILLLACLRCRLLQTARDNPLHQLVHFHSRPAPQLLEMGAPVVTLLSARQATPAPATQLPAMMAAGS